LKSLYKFKKFIFVTQKYSIALARNGDGNKSSAVMCGHHVFILPNKSIVSFSNWVYSETSIYILSVFTERPYDQC